ncbi:hypothetical protein NIES2100_21340 [Calothrix sp. NIES-2100]|uniref:hypothetical protein n=1 Tax=Calothrix sp. NIES-2100 TaxID=1954172 RepID=UPI000B5F4A72|nr:hypothetical protein NIES2100_21340 [Calothrix sp. NIES-2100]
MGKYSDIRRGVELNAALTKLRAWEDLSRTAKQTLYKAQRSNATRVKPNRVKGYVESFGLVGRIFLPVKLLSGTQSTDTTLIGIVRTAVSTSSRTRDNGFTAPTGSVLLDGLNGYKAAKLSLTDRGSEITGEQAKSRITDTAYKRYATKSVSSPFGAEADGTETYAEAVAAISDQQPIKTFLASEGNRVSFTPEVL